MKLQITGKQEIQTYLHVTIASLRTKVFKYLSGHVCNTHSNANVAKSHFQKQTVPSPPVDTRYLRNKTTYNYYKYNYF